MKQEAKGKIFVGMIVSVLAFGFATGTGIFIGANPLNTAGILDLTKQSEFPTIYTDNSNKPHHRTQTITTAHQMNRCM